MAQLTFTAPRGRTARLLEFATETQSPAITALLAGGWVCSLAALTGNGAALPDTVPWMGTVVFLVLMCLRTLDAIRDLPRDRVHHPDRPLVRGTASVTEAAVLAATLGSAAIALSAWLSPWMGLFAAVQLACGVAAVGLDRRWSAMRASMVPRLMSTVLLVAASNGLVLLWLGANGSPVQDAAWAVLAHVAVTVHATVGRDLVWMRALGAGEQSLSRTLGPLGAATVCLLVGGVGCAVASDVLTRHGASAPASLPWLALVPSYLGMRRFMSNRRRARPASLTPWFDVSLVLFFLSNAAVPAI